MRSAGHLPRRWASSSPSTFRGEPSERRPRPRSAVGPAMIPPRRPRAEKITSRGSTAHRVGQAAEKTRSSAMPGPATQGLLIAVAACSVEIRAPRAPAELGRPRSVSRLGSAAGPRHPERSAGGIPCQHGISWWRTWKSRARSEFGHLCCRHQPAARRPAEVRADIDRQRLRRSAETRKGSRSAKRSQERQGPAEEQQRSWCECEHVRCAATTPEVTLPAVCPAENDLSCSRVSSGAEAARRKSVALWRTVMRGSPRSDAAEAAGRRTCCTPQAGSPVENGSTPQAVENRASRKRRSTSARCKSSSPFSARRASLAARNTRSPPGKPLLRRATHVLRPASLTCGVQHPFSARRASLAACNTRSPPGEPHLRRATHVLRPASLTCGVQHPFSARRGCLAPRNTRSPPGGSLLHGANRVLRSEQELSWRTV